MARSWLYSGQAPIRHTFLSRVFILVMIPVHHWSRGNVTLRYVGSRYFGRSQALHTMNSLAAMSANSIRVEPPWNRFIGGIARTIMSNVEEEQSWSMPNILHYATLDTICHQHEQAWMGLLAFCGSSAVASMLDFIALWSSISSFVIHYIHPDSECSELCRTSLHTSFLRDVDSTSKEWIRFLTCTSWVFPNSGWHVQSILS
ncbi:hypothetical protein BGZ63DRAFT_1764 [Mariannaea sp. PMI_226]|nr:hypothetical protein BGZ63DRAFT_1764 [Mariannaea sp. PMI_226]